MPSSDIYSHTDNRTKTGADKMEWYSLTPHLNGCRCSLKRPRTPHTMGHLKSSQEEESVESIAAPTPKQPKLNSELKKQLNEYIEETEANQEGDVKMETKQEAKKDEGDSNRKKKNGRGTTAETDPEGVKVE